MPRRMNRLNPTGSGHFVSVIRFFERLDRLELRGNARHQRTEDLAGHNVPIRPRRRLLASDDGGIQRVDVRLRVRRAHQFGQGSRMVRVMVGKDDVLHVVRLAPRLARRLQDDLPVFRQAGIDYSYLFLRDHVGAHVPHPDPVDIRKTRSIAILKPCLLANARAGESSFAVLTILRSSLGKSLARGGSAEGATPLPGVWGVSPPVIHAEGGPGGKKDLSIPGMRKIPSRGDTAGWSAFRAPARRT